MMWKSKRTKQLEEYIDVLKSQVNALSDKKSVEIYTLVQVPGESDRDTFNRKIAGFIDDPFYLFYLTQARRKATDAFEANGKELSEYYRGKLAAIGEIFIDARQSKRILQTPAQAPEDKE